MADIIIKPPPASKPGYLRRRKTAMQIQKRLENGDDTAIDAMVDFVLANAEVTGPEGVDLRDAILDLSQEEFTRIFSPDNPVDPTNGA